MGRWYEWLNRVVSMAGGGRDAVDRSITVGRGCSYTSGDCRCHRGELYNMMICSSGSITIMIILILMIIIVNTLHTYMNIILIIIMINIFCYGQLGE